MTDFQVCPGRPKVSFVMGVYRCKHAAALRASVESIIAQTFTNWEFLIVDDGSSDGGETYAAIEAAASLDPRVIPLRYEQNHGLAYALNYCLERARGSYVARQDDDDLSNPERLFKQIAYLEAHADCAIVGSSVTLFDEGGAWGSLDVPERPAPGDFLWNSPFNHPTTVMRADALRSVGGYRVAPETRFTEDYDLFMRMYAAGFRGANISEALYRYRSERGDSKYRSMSKRMNEAKVRARGFKELRIGPKSIPYIIKPIIIGFIPKSIYGAIQHRRTMS